MRDYIRRDLARRLASEPGAPAQLTLTALARHYGVSLTPVREAIGALVADGVLSKAGNGRMQVNAGRARRARTRPDAKPPGRAADLEATLAAELIVRSLRGDREYLREQATAQRLRVGRTAVRQAFGRLAGRGLIVHVPRCGWRVRAFDAADLPAYLEVREALELKALDLARPNLDPDDLRRMLAGNAADGPAARLDNRLHSYLVEKSGNAYIREFFDRHGAYYTALFDYAAPETSIVEAMARQHREILQALLAEDWPGAREALGAHIRAQRPIVEALLLRLAANR